MWLEVQWTCTFSLVIILRPHVVLPAHAMWLPAAIMWSRCDSM